jgi:hypothetical protein
MADVNDYAEWAAKWHDEWAAGCRHVAETTRRDWTGPGYSDEDNRANHADAREHDRKAGEHERNARAFRAMKTLTPSLEKA